MRKRDRIDVFEAMRAENPAQADEVAATLSEARLEDELEWVLAAAEAGTRGNLEDGAPGAAQTATRPARRRGARRRALAIGLAAAAAAFVAAIVLVANDPANRGSVGGGQVAVGDGPLYTEAAMHVAEVNPRLLVTAPGWKVVRTESFEANSGHVIFGDGHQHLAIDWNPAALYPTFRRDILERGERQVARHLNSSAHIEAGKPVPSTLLGQAATTHLGPGGGSVTVLAPQGQVFIEVRAKLSSRAEYRSVLHSLRAVSVDRWLGAMPASVVKPTERSTVVAEILRGVPYPSTFHPAAIEREESLLDRYGLGIKVTGEVACDWLGQWVDATATGDGAAAEEAVEAMRTSHHWPILRELAKRGAYPSMIRKYADELAGAHLDQRPSGYLTETDGTKYAIGPAYATALGCKSQYKRRVN